MTKANLSFERFVVGSANALAATAARRAAETPGTVYNPLIIAGGSGVGKSHLLHAILRYATTIEPDLRVHLEDARQMADRVAQGSSAATGPELARSFGEPDLLLIDELECLSGMERTQEVLVEVAGPMLKTGRQVVFASLVPPLDLSGFIPVFRELLGKGVVVEIGRPDPDMRGNLVAGFARDAGAKLPRDVADALADFEFADVPSLRAAVGALLDRAALHGRAPRVEDVVAVLENDIAQPTGADEFGSFLDDVTRTLTAVVETEPWRRRIADAILHWDGQGLQTRRLEAALQNGAPPDVDRLLARFEREATRLLEIRAELSKIGISELPDDPGDLAGAERFLTSARRRAEGADVGSVTQTDPGSNSHASAIDEWFIASEKVVLDWLDLDGRLVSEPR